MTETTGYQEYAAAIEKKFARVGAVTTVTYDLGDGVYVHYEAVELADDLQAIFYHDAKIIAIKHGEKYLVDLKWNDETEQLIADFDDMSAFDLLSLMKEYGGDVL